jgi:signal transduction histidine kinase
MLFGRKTARMIQEDHAIAQLDALSRIMNVGALVLGPATAFEFASPLACELLGAASPAELRSRWNELKRPLLGDPGELPSSAVPLRRVVDLHDRERSLRLEIYRLGEGATGYLVLVKDRRTVDMLETDLVLASQMRSLAHVYRVLAHDLRAPLNSMQLAVDLLDGPGADAERSRDPAASPERWNRRSRSAPRPALLICARCYRRSAGCSCRRRAASASR